MEIVPYHYKDSEKPVAFIIKNIFGDFSSKVYNSYFNNNNILHEEFPAPDNISHSNNSLTFGAYCDPLSLCFLENLKDEVEKAIGEPILPSYSYTRVYTKGSRLTSHKDRKSCEISLTLSLFNSGQNKTEFLYISEKDEKESTGEDILAVPLNIGEALIFFGSGDTNDGYFHWRDITESDFILQSFLHYVKESGEFAENAYEWTKIDTPEITLIPND